MQAGLISGALVPRVLSSIHMPPPRRACSSPRQPRLPAHPPPSSIPPPMSTPENSLQLIQRGKQLLLCALKPFLLCGEPALVDTIVHCSIRRDWWSGLVFWGVLISKKQSQHQQSSYSSATHQPTHQQRYCSPVS